MTSLKNEATEQYFVVVQFIMLHKIVLTLSLWMKSCSVTLIQMKAVEHTRWFKLLNLWLKS